MIHMFRCQIEWEREKGGDERKCEQPSGYDVCVCVEREKENLDWELQTIGVC
jgi:hypothetical protein